MRNAHLQTTHMSLQPLSRQGGGVNHSQMIFGKTHLVSNGLRQFFVTC